MIVTHNIKADLAAAAPTAPQIDAVQGDANTRAVAITLTANGAPFQVPDGTAAAVRFRKMDGTGGVYSTMPDGSNAYSIDGSIVTVLLAPQVLTCSGIVWISVELTGGSNVLGIFTFLVYVHRDPSVGTAPSENYFSYDTLESINTAVAGALAAVDGIDSRISLALADMTQIEAQFAESIEDCTDTSRVYILPDGYIYAYQLSIPLESYVNYLLLSTDENGNPYNGGQGWKADTRLNSSGTEVTASGTEVTGFIPLTIGDVLRFENMKIAGVSPNTTQYIVFYDSNKTKLKHVYTHNLVSMSNQAPYFTLDIDNYWQTYNTVNLEAMDGEVDWSDLSYFRLSAEEITADSAIIINDETNSSEAVYAWSSTGHAFVPADYEDRILALEASVKDHSTGLSQTDDRLDTLEAGYGSVVLPSYWKTHCDEKIAVIRSAMEEAGRNKSAFLWYTDVHWAYGSQMSPRLLKYLYQNTAINKVNFGGDIVDDYAVSAEKCMDGLRVWRLETQDIPNHHSVVGNHDNDIEELSTDARRYGFLMAAEENPHIVRGGDFYYYIDDPNEKTRYLYLDTSMCTSSTAAGDADAFRFVIDALKAAPFGWHIVAVSHIWFLYADTSEPTVGNIPDYCQTYLDLFDALNARSSGTITVNGSDIAYDFSDAGSKVEFCIGGHTHVDHDFTSTAGIPVILTETDSCHIRSSLSYTTSTIHEASVSAIVADYDNGKISVIRIGRGSDREILI